MSAESRPEQILERLATLAAEIERLQLRVVNLLSRHLETADVEQSLLLLVETRRTYAARLEQLQRKQL